MKIDCLEDKFVISQAYQKVLTETLNLPGVLVTGYQKHEGIGIFLEVESKSREKVCPRCKEVSRCLHQNHKYLVKDLPMSGQDVYLRVNRRQLKCKKCGKPFSEELDYVNKNRTHTKRLAREIIGQVLDSDIRSVSERSDLSEDEIQTIINDIGEQLIEEIPKGLRRLGIDEIALVKGQGNYCAVLVDLDLRKPLTLWKSRRQEELRQVLTGWGEEVLREIEEVSIDLWRPYRDLVEEMMPNATVVADRFHVTKVVNEELDKERKRERRSAEKIKRKKKREEILEAIKGTKYVLLKKKEDLNNEQREKLFNLKKKAPNLGKMHELKEKFRVIFEDFENWLDPTYLLISWLKEAKQYFPESYCTIVRWFGEICGYFDSKTSNGIVEGINNKLKLIKRLGYGFRNFGNFKTRALLCWYYEFESA